MKDTKRNLRNNIWNARYIYLLLLPGVVYLAVFNYAPMYGLLMAFQNFNARLGIWGSEWVGLAHFRRLFITPDSLVAIRNTFIISFSRLVIEFPFPIFLAIMINEMRGRKLKRVYQTIYTFPHFLSWIIVAAIMRNFLANSGAINEVIVLLGGERVNFLANASTFRGILYGSSIWKSAGWSAIIYMAAIAGINPELYEAASVDGAGRIRSIWHVLLPGITPTILVLFILAVGNTMNAGFEQILNMENPAVRHVTEIIDTYVYRITFLATPNFGFSTAVGMFKAIINLLMLLLANFAVKKFSGSGLFS